MIYLELISSAREPDYEVSDDLRNSYFFENFYCLQTFSNIQK